VITSSPGVIRRQCEDFQRSRAGEGNRPDRALGVESTLGQGAECRQSALAVGAGDLDGVAAQNP